MLEGLRGNRFQLGAVTQRAVGGGGMAGTGSGDTGHSRVLNALLS